MAKSTRAARGEPLRWLDAKLVELQANPTDACVIFPFGKTKGYGEIWIDGRMRRVCAVVLERTKGPRPAGMEACHAPVICHNAACINPAHLRYDTPRNNRLDMLLDGTHRRSKLSARDAREIPQLHATGEWTQSQLAREFGVTRTAIADILHGRTWSHLGEGPRSLGKKHPHAKLMPHQVNLIRRRLAAGESAVRLAKMYGVSESTISSIRNGTRWTSLPAKRILRTRTPKRRPSGTAQELEGQGNEQGHITPSTSRS